MINQILRALLGDHGWRTESLIEAFDSRFPDKCVLCSFRRHQLREFSEPPPLPEHACKESVA